MKIITKTGNLMNVSSGNIVHGTNARGAFASGVAKAVRDTYPTVYEDYMFKFQRGELKVGAVFPIAIDNKLTIWNAVTQDNYGGNVRQVSYDGIEICFSKISSIVELDDDPTIHIPMIGAGRGGGNWEIIREIIEQTVTVPVVLWLPDDTVTTI